MCYSEVTPMARAVKIATGFPSAAEAAKKLHVSKAVAKQLSSLANHSRKTGEYMIPGVGRLVRVETRTDSEQSGAITPKKAVKFRIAKDPSKKVVKFRVSKSAQEAKAACNEEG